ncbi:two-component response regulator-like APRR1 [Malania oleifera]|uniref:two-component response regulator-like APRR1 n=1 Tax=Malania oleifera TaxID=397392 RepID=UPI0025AEBD8A|nr:two-component response regulator-like APRR1 [Malania oleifera]
MYGYGHNSPAAAAFPGEFFNQYPVPEFNAVMSFPSASAFPPPPVIIPEKLGSAGAGEFDSACEALQVAGGNMSSGSTSGYSSYGSPSYATQEQRPSLIQRSVSSHSLMKNGFAQHLCSPTEFFNSEMNGPVRRVFSTGDLQKINMVQHSHRSESPLSNETTIIEGISRVACRYSPEEKKERIERYRSKRNQRNFNKKIKYVCRKTLADSRPRIRGRFARNDEVEKSPQTQWSHVSGEEDDEDDDNWINLIDDFSANLIP